MCQHSLYHFPNRPCEDDEDLISYRFASGCIGLVSVVEGKAHSQPTWLQEHGPSLRSWFFPRRRENGPVAVCVPPGTRVTVGATERALFTQSKSDINGSRDILRFEDGRELHLQRLRAGTRVRVTSRLFGSEPVRGAQTEVEYATV